jgi:hypothetical protein
MHPSCNVRIKPNAWNVLLEFTPVGLDSDTHPSTPHFPKSRISGEVIHRFIHKPVENKSYPQVYPQPVDNFDFSTGLWITLSTGCG